MLTVLYRKAKLTRRIGQANIQICYIGHPTDNLGAMDLLLEKLQKLQNRAARVLPVLRITLHRLFLWKSLTGIYYM